MVSKIASISEKPSIKAAAGVRTQRSLTAPGVNPYWALGLSLAGLLLVAYGFLWQTAQRDPFSAPANWADWFFHPQPAAEIASLDQRSLAWPGAGWAPRALGETHAAWIGSGALQIRPEGRFPTLGIWSDGSGGLIGADGVIYRPGQLPIKTIQSGSTAISMGISAISMGISKTFGSGVTSAAFSPDGGRIVTTSDGLVQIWDSTNGAELKALRVSEVHEAAFSPDGSRIVTTSADNTARIWDTSDGTQLSVLSGHEDMVHSAAFSPDGSRIVTASADNTARIWDASDGTQLSVLIGHEHEVNSATFSPDGSRIVTTSADNTARIWDASDGTQLSVLIGHELEVNSAAFSPDGRRIVTAADDRTARIWDAATGEQLGVLRGHEDMVHSAAYASDGSRIATASVDQTVRIWGGVSGTQLGAPSVVEVSFDARAAITAAFSPDGNRIVIGSNAGWMRVWDLTQGSSPLAGVTLPDGAVCWTENASGWACSSGEAPPPVLVSLRLDDHARGGPLSPSARIGPVDAGGEKRQQQQQQNRVQQQQLPSRQQDQQQLQQPPPQQQQQQQQQQEPLAQLAMPADLPADAKFRAVAFRDATTLFVVGDGGIILAAEQLTTTSATFKLMREPQPGETLTGIRFDGSGAWVVGQRSRPAAIWPFSILMGANPVKEPIVLHADNALSGPWWELRASPAPWSFVAGPLVFLALGYFGVAAARGAVVERRGISDAPSSDSPIGWRDHDALRLKPIALAMSRFIRNVDTKPPLTIAVTGGWGTGKSSLMNLLREDLRRYGARPVWFNAWHHREETSLLAALLEAVRRTAVPPLYTWTGMTFRARLLALRLKMPLQGALAAVVLLLVAASVANWSLRGEFGSALTGVVASFQQTQTTNQATSQVTGGEPGRVAGSASGEAIASPPGDGGSAGAGGAAGTAQETAKGATANEENWFEKALAWLGLNPRTGLGAILTFAAFLFVRSKLIAFPVEPARLLSELRSRASVADFRDKLSFRSQFAAAFGEVCRAARTGRNPGVVIVIDDLDRCPPDAVLAVLEAVNYLVSAGPCFVVLGIDRSQIEHAVGLGFKDIVEGLSDRELGRTVPLPGGDDPSVRTAGRRRAFARRYLEKLINIETAVPPLQPEAAVRMLVDEGPELGVDPWWLGPFKRAASFILDFCRAAAIAAVIGGFAALLLEPFVSGEIGATPPTLARPGGETAPAPAEATGQEAAVASSEKPFRFEPAAWHAERELMPRWAWWVGDGLLLTFAALFLFVDLARRRIEIEKDSDAFAETLRKITPYVHETNPTPRAVKLFENRMRYLAARLDAEANPRRPDLLDRIMGRFLPKGWFDRKPPALDETKLLILGAHEVSGKLPGDLLSQINDADRRAYTSIVSPASPET